MSEVVILARKHRLEKNGIGYVIAQSRNRREIYSLSKEIFVGVFGVVRLGIIHHINFFAWHSESIW